MGGGLPVGFPEIKCQTPVMLSFCPLIGIATVKIKVELDFQSKNIHGSKEVFGLKQNFGPNKF